MTASAFTPWYLCMLPASQVQMPSVWHPVAAVNICVCQAFIDCLPHDRCTHLGQLMLLQCCDLLPCTGSAATCLCCKLSLVMWLLLPCTSVGVQRHTCYADLFVLHCVTHASWMTVCHSCSLTKLLLLQAECIGKDSATSLLFGCQWCVHTTCLCN